MKASKHHTPASLPGKPYQGHIARKRFGQNFLTDLSIVAAIIAAIAPQRGECVVEIGPGLGALTAPLLEQAGTLHAVELDRNLIERLRQRFGEQLILHEGDALTYDFAALAKAAPRQPSLRIVGNLPYNISSPLLFHLLQASEVVIDQHFMLQNEVVERMTAEPGTKAYGRLSVMLQTRYWMEKILDVPPQAFKPAPKVDSALIRMIPLSADERREVDWAVLSELVATAFSQRRKMLRNTLASYRDRLDFAALGFDLARRAEEVPVEEYVQFAQRLAAG